MKKLLLTTSALVGVVALASNASAQNVNMMSDQGAGMKASFGGTIGVSLQGYSVSKAVELALPSWRNYISVAIDGNTAFGLEYGGYIRYRPFDGGTGPDKAYVYLGHKYFGTVTLGKDNTLISNYFADGSNIVPGFSQNGDGEQVFGVYNYTTLAIDGGNKPVGVTYVTPSIYGIVLGYGYHQGFRTDFLGDAGLKDAPVFGSGTPTGGATHTFMARFDGSWGGFDLGLYGGGIIQTASAFSVGAGGFSTGAHIGYSDGRAFGFALESGYHFLSRAGTNADGATGANGYLGGDGYNADGGKNGVWSIGLSMDSPALPGFSFGLLYGGGRVDSSNLSGGDGVVGQHFAIGVGYAWSDNFQQTLAYDRAWSAEGDAKGASDYSGWSWTLASQVSF